MTEGQRPARSGPAVLERFGPIQFLTSTEIIITAGSLDEQYEIAFVQFWKDGSIFVQPRRFEAPEGGVAAVVPWRPNENPPFIFRIPDYGKRASSLLKLSHKPDGRVHFSQDGRIYTRIQRTSFSLRTAIGRVFSIEAVHLEGFPPYRATKKNRLYLHFRAGTTVPKRIRLFGEWVRKADILNTIAPGEIRGPKAYARRSSSNVTVPVVYVGQPQAYPLRGHVLMVGAELRSQAHRLAEEVDRSTIVLFGGWDHEEFAPGRARVIAGEALAGLYPYRPSKGERLKLESIDFHGETEVA